MSKELEARLRGRAQFCADRKEIKTPELLTEAADQLERYREEIYRLEERNRVGEGAMQIVAALSALIPLKDSLEANRNGQTLVDYFRQALSPKP